MPERPTLLLFDVDLTLIRTRGAGLRALRRALDELFDAGDVTEGYRPHGRLDRGIIRELLEAAGQPSDLDAVGAVAVRYLEHLAVTVAEGVGPERMPGVPEILDACALRGFDLALLTGNMRAGARIKLAPVELGGYFPIGAFGDDADERAALVPVGVTRAQAHYGRDYTPERVVVIGDTPLDVACAQAAGVVSVAVAAGDHDRETLAACAPDLLLDDLTDAEALFAAVR